MYGVMMSFFVFKQKTAYEMRISDWSSDVCSSDLADLGGGPEGHRHPGERAVAGADGDRTGQGGARRGGSEGLRLDDPAPAHGQSGGTRSRGDRKSIV